MNFIFLSSCPWRGILQRPHQMARALVKIGHSVQFIEPPLDSHNDSVQYKDIYDLCDKLLELNLERKRMIEGVNVYSPIAKYNDNIVKTYSIKLLCEHLLSGNEKNVIVSYFPSHIEQISQIRGTFTLVYDCVDDHTDLEHSYWSSPIDIEYEARMLDKADIILTTSWSLFLNKSIGRDNVFLSKNAINLSDFEEDVLEEPIDLRNIPKPRICYVGTIDKRFNRKLFYEVVRSNPDKSFIIIGPVINDIFSESCPNLYILGPKDHSELKNYLKNMDVGIIPFFDDIDLVINCDSIKHYEYLACGLPVVSTPLPDLCQNKSFIKIAHQEKEFSNSIDELLKSKIKYDEIRPYLEENTWVIRAMSLINIIENKQSNHRHKEWVHSDLQSKWRYFLGEENNYYIIKSLYGLIFAEKDPKLFLKYAEEAYRSEENIYTLRNYIVALYVNGYVNKVIEILLNSFNVSDLLKAEISLYEKIEDFDALRLQIFYCIRKFDIMRDLLMSISSESPNIKFALGNYYYETGRYNEALEIYNQLLQSPLYDISPLFNYNLGKLLTGFGLLRKGQKLYFRSLILTDRLLSKEDRFTRWKNMFIKDKETCDNCGEKKNRLVLIRPDGQEIVSCIRCGLSYLKKMPIKEELYKIYDDKSYYVNADIAGYRDYNYFHKKDYIFIPRIEWINNNIKGDYRNKKILDIGCADGEFLDYARKFGWEPFGIEISKECYEICKNKGIQVFNEELKKVNFPNEFFDCVTLWDVIEHYISPKDELREIYRILKPDGKLFISTPNHRKGLVEGENWIGYNSSYEHLYYFEPATLINMLISLGFKVDECFTHEIGDWNFTNIRSIGHILLISARK